MCKSAVLVFAMFLLCVVTAAQEETWLTKIKRIVPLETTEHEVERMFGKSMVRHDGNAKYILPEGRLYIAYSRGRCLENDEPDYDVEQGTVLYVDFFYKEAVDAQSLKLDISQFKQLDVIPDLPSVKQYLNEKTNIEYNLDRGMLNAVSIRPHKKHDSLLCVRQL